MEPDEDLRDESKNFGYFPSHKIEYHQAYLNQDILYIRFNYFLPKMMDFIRDTLTEATGRARGLILDLRSNTGGLTVVATGLTGLLVDEKTNLGKLDLKNGHITYQGYPQKDRFSGPVAILVDGGTVSTSEMLAAGLQEAGRARIFGETTLG